MAITDYEIIANNFTATAGIAYPLSDFFSVVAEPEYPASATESNIWTEWGFDTAQSPMAADGYGLPSAANDVTFSGLYQYSQTVTPNDGANSWYFIVSGAKPSDVNNQYLTTLQNVTVTFSEQLAKAQTSIVLSSILIQPGGQEFVNEGNGSDGDLPEPEDLNGGTVTLVSPTTANGTDIIGHNTVTNLASLFTSLTTSPSVGDSEHLTGATSQLGTITAQGVYTSPASGPDTLSYTMTDNKGVSSTASVVITVDTGPTLAPGSFSLAFGQQVDLTNLITSLITPGITGDTEKITSFTAQAGVASINNQGHEIYYPTGTITNDTLTYIVEDEFNDQATGTLAATITPCFVAGTQISTVTGWRSVEGLRKGDRVRTVAGSFSQVVWLGHRRVTCFSHPEPQSVWPVRVSRSAVSDGIPRRDLWLSPDHAVYIDDMLIPIKHLINGHSITQIEFDCVEYWHVELARHDILVAEGLPAESYLDTGNRHGFANSREHTDLFPDFTALTWENACAELVQDGPRVVAVKQRLFERAGIDVGHAPRTLRVRAGVAAIKPQLLGDGAWRFILPPQTRTLHLDSYPWVPAEQSAMSLDRRTLGVRLLGVSIDDVDCDLADAVFGFGFYEIEHTAEGPCRWTNGGACLVLPGDVRSVTLTIGDYPLVAQDVWFPPVGRAVGGTA